MKIGFTGTQVGMSQHQLKSLSNLLNSQPVEEFHHGDCIGADSEADALVRILGIVPHIHPPTDPSKRAWCGDRPGTDYMYLRKPYLDRNRDIVDLTDLLVAAPKSDTEELRSGTWSTVRYARKKGKKVHILER